MTRAIVSLKGLLVRRITHEKNLESSSCDQKVRRCINDNILYILYYPFVYPHSTYEIVTWGNSSIGYFNGMPVIQKKFSNVSIRSYICILEILIEVMYRIIIIQLVFQKQKESIFLDSEIRIGILGSQTSFLCSEIISWNFSPL